MSRVKVFGRQFFRYIKWAIKRPSVHIATLLILGAGVVIGRTQLPLAVRITGQDSVPVKGPLRVDFRQDVASGYTISIDPDVAGNWSSRRSPLGITEATFAPQTQFDAGRTYTLHVTHLKRVSGQPLADITLEFTTEIAPGIKSISPANNAKDVAAKPKLIVVRSDSQARELVAELKPKVEVKQLAVEGASTIWEPAKQLKQGSKYTLTISDPKLPKTEQNLISSTFVVVKQPKIIKATSGDHFHPGKTIDIKFDQEMDPANAKFTFGVGGKGQWVNSKLYRYTPEGIQPGKVYSYKVGAGTMSRVGGVIEKTTKYKIATNGRVTARFSPGGTVGINAPLKVTFDQEIDHASAESRFRVSPSVSGTKSWSGNVLTFVPKGMDYQTGYTFTVAPGVTLKWGLPNKKTLVGSYATVAQVKILNVPLYKQPYGRSCELTSLRMLLAYRGIQTSEMTIVGRIGYNPRVRGSTWDNPNSMFVGYIDTYDWARGYGVHAGPVAAAARSYGRSATAYFGVSAAFIASQVWAGNPVEVYGHIGPAYADSWNTSSGVVNTTTSMHARVVYGVVGSKTNPTGFYVNDAWYGSAGYWSAGALLANMNAVPGVSNQAVVVR